MLSTDVQKDSLWRRLENTALQRILSAELLDQCGGQVVSGPLQAQRGVQRISHGGAHARRFGLHHPQAEVRFGATPGKRTGDQQPRREDAAYTHSDSRINQFRSAQLQFGQDLVQDVPFKNRDAPGALQGVCQPEQEHLLFPGSGRQASPAFAQAERPALKGRMSSHRLALLAVCPLCVPARRGRHELIDALLLLPILRGALAPFDLLQ